MSIGLGMVFVAGLVSFLSPCVISLVPGYLGALGLEEVKGEGKLKVFWVGLVFFLGFTFVFLTFGLTATLLGSVLFAIKPWVARIGGLVILVFGLHLTGLVTLPCLNYEKKVNLKKEFRNKYILAFMLGIFFSAGWSPCIGPILGSILTALAIGEFTVGEGILFLFVYSLGMGLPFLLAAIGFQPLSKKISHYKKGLHFIQVASGIILCLSGILLIFGIFSKLAQFSFQWML